MLLPRKLLGLIYLAIGIFLAASKDYLENLDTLKQILSALLRSCSGRSCSWASTFTSSSYNPPPWPATDFVST
jgi:hypothetical protein